ncbi:hypothetical protein GCM10023201_30340 [Actinomycetospora corticicola]|uniref:Uncharacterized protein n=1 Tax=Actinomycetospora corticicola TaxID=663602 RepID=A0A7Y9J535_9PSEU|nr:hypothetical protein [Actinomycetospora corticicola]NYD35556.1 hypothetical protein [Actinomycetospora corticicola]
MVGPIVWSIVAVVVALVALALLVGGLLRSLRRTSAVSGALGSLLSDRVALLRARAAALGVRMEQRRTSDSSPVQSGTTTPSSEGNHP